MRSFRAIRATVRVELRSLARSPLRSSLVIVLIAIPVAALTGGATLLRTTLPTSAERTVRLLGAADLRIDGGASDVARVIAGLPSGSRIDALSVHPESISAAGVRASAWRAHLVAGGLATPMFRVVSGRLPQSADEVALAPRLADALTTAIGDAVHLGSDAGPRTVVGLVVDPEALDRPLVVTPPGDTLPAGAATTQFASLPNGGSLAPKVPGARVRTAMDAGRPFDIEAALLFVFGSLGFVEAALVIAAAFAVGLRRRQREVGLLLASGAAPREIIAGVLASATLLAMVGGIAGVGAGVGAAALVHPHLDAWTQRLNGPLELPVVQLVVAGALGIPTAIVAAAIPAAHAARLPIRTALAGRRPDPSPPHRRAAVGLATVGTGMLTILASLSTSGIAAAICVLAGAVATVLGFGACSPWILEALSRRVSRLPVALRLAVRDAGRARGRNGPVVTAVLSSLAFSVMLAAALRSGAALETEGFVELRDDQVRFDGLFAEQASREFVASTAGFTAAALRAARLDGEVVHGRVDTVDPASWIAIGDDATLHVLGIEGRALPTSDALLAIGSIPDGRSVALVTATTGRRVAELSSVSTRIGSRIPALRFVMSPSEAARRGFDAGPPPDRTTESWLVRGQHPIDVATLELARDLAARHPGTTVAASLLQQRQPRVLWAVALALSILTGLVVVGASTALSAAESRTDRAILDTLGASPRLRRDHAAAQACYLTAVGCVLAIPAGLVPAFGALTAIAGLPIVVPWLELALTLTIAPGIAGAIAWSAPRRPSWPIRR